MKISINKKKLLDYWGIIILILSSGASFFMGKSYIPVLLTLSITVLVFLNYDRPTINLTRYKKKSFTYIIYFVIWVIINCFIINRNILNSNWIATICNAIFSFFIISRYPFFHFKRIYLNIITILSILSLIIYYGTEYNYFTPTTEIIRGSNYMFVLNHVVGWEYLFHRNASIFHEPGAFQFYLNFALIFYIPELKNNKLNRKDKFKFIIITFTLITTKSTMAYLILFSIICLIIIYSKLIKRIKILLPFAITVILVGLFFVMQTEVIAKKIGTNDVGEEHVSKIRRTRDLITSVEMTLESPIFGYGIHTKEFQKRNWGESGVCIGLFNTSAQLGLIWLIIFSTFVYKGIKKMNLEVPPIFVLLIFMLIECNEAYIEAPISYFFIIHFLNYNQTKSRLLLNSNKFITIKTK